MINPKLNNIQVWEGTTPTEETDSPRIIGYTGTNKIIGHQIYVSYNQWRSGVEVGSLAYWTYNGEQNLAWLKSKASMPSFQGRPIRIYYLAD